MFNAQGPTKVGATKANWGGGTDGVEDTVLHINPKSEPMGSLRCITIKRLECSSITTLPDARNRPLPLFALFLRGRGLGSKTRVSLCGPNWPRTQRSSCLTLPRAEITGVHHRGRLFQPFNFQPNEVVIISLHALNSPLTI